VLGTFTQRALAPRHILLVIVTEGVPGGDSGDVVQGTAGVLTLVSGIVVRQIGQALPARLSRPPAPLGYGRW